MPSYIMKDGTLYVPAAPVELPNGVIGDGVAKLKPGDPRYDEHLRFAEPAPPEFIAALNDTVNSALRRNSPGRTIEIGFKD